MFYLLKQMDQVKVGETDIFDTLERAHNENPFFDFDSEVRFPIEVVRWKSRKLVKQMDREMAWQFRIPTDMEIKRAQGDTVPNRISLEGFSLNINRLDIADRWSGFIERSRQRTKTYHSQSLSSYEKVFKRGLSDMDGFGVGGDDLISFGNDEFWLLI